MPIHMKYILWAAANNKDIFDPADQIKEEEDVENDFKEENEFPNIIKSLKLNETQNLKIKKMKKKFTKEHKRMDGLMNRLFDVKETMKKELFSLE